MSVNATYRTLRSGLVERREAASNDAYVLRQVRISSPRLTF